MKSRRRALKLINVLLIHTRLWFIVYNICFRVCSHPFSIMYRTFRSGCILPSHLSSHVFMSTVLLLYAGGIMLISQTAKWMKQTVWVIIVTKIAISGNYIMQCLSLSWNADLSNRKRRQRHDSSNAPLPSIIQDPRRQRAKKHHFVHFDSDCTCRWEIAKHA